MTLLLERLVSSRLALQYVKSEKHFKRLAVDYLRHKFNGTPCWCTNHLAGWGTLLYNSRINFYSIIVFSEEKQSKLKETQCMSEKAVFVTEMKLVTERVLNNYYMYCCVQCWRKPSTATSRGTHAMS